MSSADQPLLVVNSQLGHIALRPPLTSATPISTSVGSSSTGSPMLSCNCPSLPRRSESSYSPLEASREVGGDRRIHGQPGAVDAQGQQGIGMTFLTRCPMMGRARTALSALTTEAAGSSSAGIITGTELAPAFDGQERQADQRIAAGRAGPTTGDAQRPVAQCFEVLGGVGGLGGDLDRSDRNGGGRGRGRRWVG